MKNLIIVTGGAGFVGSNLIKSLLKKTNKKIVSLDNYSSGNKKNHIKACFNVTENLNFFNAVKEKLGIFSVKSEAHREGKKQIVRISIPITQNLEN